MNESNDDLVKDQWLRDAYERALPSGDVLPPLDDVSAERLRRLAEGEGDESERLHTLDLALSTAEGRRELEIAWAAVRAARTPHRSWRRYAVAAGLLVAVGSSTLLVRGHTTADTPVLRGADSPVTLVAPMGTVSAPNTRRFVWRPVRGAERYQVVVVDTTGADVFASETRDTALALPDSVHLVPGHSYLWWVQARLVDQSTVTAVTQRVVITEP